jgi:hypothetical protein
MATYPSDATISQASFSIISTVKYTNTSTTTDFNLGSSANFTGEIVAIADGVTQATDSYTLHADKEGITFLVAPNAANLVLRVVSVPSRFTLNRTITDVRSVDYSNTSITTVNGNAFIINGNTESFSLPAEANISTDDELFVYVSGVFQEDTAYTFPSAVYGNFGIDIGDNTATKLLCNFEGADEATTSTDESPSSHTLTFRDGAELDTAIKHFGNASLKLDGTRDNVSIAASSDFDLLEDNFTLECFVRPASHGSQTAILTRYASATDFYKLDILADSNVRFMYMKGGSNVTVKGGNVNTGAFYHVAVSYDYQGSDGSNLQLYVNNVRVQNASMSFSNHAVLAADAPLEIGTANGINNENFNGHIDALRISKSLKYRTAGAQAMNTAPTVIGGGALGAIQDTDKLSIRSFGMTVTTLDRFTSMADRKPDKGFNRTESFDVATFTSQAGYEKRRLKSRRSKRAYSLTYTNITGIERTAIEEFYRARNGTFEAFTFDLSHLNDSGTINARFEGPLSVTQVLSTGTALVDNFFTVSFGISEVFD